MKCPNGLGQCTQEYCVLETCPLIKEFKLLRLQEETFRRFWERIEFDAFVEGLFAYIDRPPPTLYLYDFTDRGSK